MKKRDFMRRILVCGVIVALQLLAVPFWADDSSASLSGTILSASDDSPMAGATLHVGDPRTGRIYSSAVTDDHGTFRVGDLPPATYELAVQAGPGLFVVGSPVALAPGQSQKVNLAVNQSAGAANAKGAGKAGKAAGKTASSFWNNPLTAGLIVIGSAVVLGVAIDAATKDDPASPSS